MNNLLERSKVFIGKNASTILTCVGGAGVVATAVLAVKATPKALRAIEQAEEEKGEDLTKLETVITAGPAYIPSVLVGASTIACIFGANALNKRQQAALMSAYALLDNSYKEYRNKVEEIYGEGANMEVKTEIAKDKYEEEKIEVEGNEQLFFDDFSGRYFESTIEKVQRAEYLLNQRLAITSYVCLNEFYDLLGIDEIDGGDEIGWCTWELLDSYLYSWIEFNHDKVPINDDLECIIITMPIEPYIDFSEY